MMHESQGILIVFVGFVLVFALSSVQVVVIYWFFSVVEFSAPKSVDILIKSAVILASVLEALWILNRVPMK